MDTDEHDRLSPRGDGEFSRIVLAAIDDIRREEPQEAVVERVIVRALDIPSLCDATVSDCPREMVAAKNSHEPVGLPWLSARISSPHWIRGLTMRQRIAALGGVGVAAVLGFLLLWGGTVAKPVSAMEKMAQNIREAKSYKYNVSVQFEGNSIVSRNLTGTAYWLAPGFVRTETTYPDEWKKPGPEQVDIYPAGKPGIHIFHPTKTFSRIPVPQKAPLTSGMDDIASLGRFTGKADRQLGNKEVNGKNAQGFVIANDKMYPDGISGSTEIWLDTETNLPVYTRHEGKSPGRSWIQENTNIQWNIDLDPKLFDPTPPEGYTDTTRKPPALEEQVRQIGEALRIYAEASGHYPPRSPDSATIDEFCNMLGIVKWPRMNDKEGNAGKLAKLTEGVAQISEIHAYKPEFAYYGNTVGPSDKEKVLLRWKLDDGKYEVIFGDLRSQTVTAERLRALEGK